MITSIVNCRRRDIYNALKRKSCSCLVVTIGISTPDTSPVPAVQVVSRILQRFQTHYDHFKCSTHSLRWTCHALNCELIAVMFDIS